MDNVTHTLLGVAMAKTGLQRTYGRGTTTVLVVASNLCDVDILSVFAGTSTAVLVRRTVSHSIFGILVLSLVAACVFRRVYRHFQFRVLFGLCLLGCVVHVFFDWLNAYGVALLAPLVSRWFEADVLFVTDPFLIGVLLLPCIVTAVWRWGRSGRSPEVAWQVGLALVVGYVGFCAWNRGLAAESLARYAAQEGLPAQETYVIPEPLGPHRWSGILRAAHRYQVMLIHSWSGSVDHVQVVDSMVEDPRVQRVREDARAGEVEHFFKAPVWRAEGNVVVARDLRFSYHVLHNAWDPFRFRFKLAENRVALQKWTVKELCSELLGLVRALGGMLSACPETVPHRRP